MYAQLAVCTAQRAAEAAAQKAGTYRACNFDGVGTDAPIPQLVAWSGVHTVTTTPALLFYLSR